MKRDKLYTILSPKFIAGIIVDSQGKVIKTAPILKALKGWHIDEVIAWTKKRGHKIENIERKHYV